MKRKTAIALCVCFVLLGSQIADAKGPIESFTAFAANMQKGKAGVVQIQLDRWSTDAEREMLRTTLKEKGPDALLTALQGIKPRIGFMRLPNTVGWDLYFARDIKREDGTRQVILASDRPISMGEVRNSTRSMDYAFTIIDIRFDAEGKGKGTLASAAKIWINEKTNMLEIENYGAMPTDLINVKSEKKK